jgi:hypothetical protein
MEKKIKFLLLKPKKKKKKKEIDSDFRAVFAVRLSRKYGEFPVFLAPICV